MQPDITHISKWSKKGKPARKQSAQNGSAYQKLPPGIHSEISETVSPKIAALSSAQLSKDAPQEPGLPPPETPSIAVKPTTAPAARVSEQSCIETASSRGASSVKSAGSHISGRPSTASTMQPDLRSQAIEADVSDAGATRPLIRHLTRLL